MKYWIVTSQAPPTGGGIDTYVGEMRRALTERGHDVLVVVAKHALGTAFVIRDDVPGQVEFSPVAWSHGAKFGGGAVGVWGVEPDSVLDPHVSCAPDYIEFQDYEGLLTSRCSASSCWRLATRRSIVVRVHGPRCSCSTATRRRRGTRCQDSGSTRWSASPWRRPALCSRPVTPWTRGVAGGGLQGSTGPRPQSREVRFVPEGPDRYDGPLVFLGRASYLKGLGRAVRGAAAPLRCRSSRAAADHWARR